MSFSPDLVLIEWEDSAQPLPAWQLLEDAVDLEIVKCRSVGWVVREDSAVLLLAPNLGDAESGSPQGCGFLRIPARAITRRVRLEEAR